MKHMKRLHLIWVCLVCMTVLAPGGMGAASSHAVKCGGWSMVPSPNPYNAGNVLAGVAVVSAQNVWAVGSGGNANSPSQTLIEHWNGTSWQVVASPNSETSGLNAITALASNDIWAVGYAQDTTQTLIEHWDGKQWSIVPSPNVGSYANILSSVAAVSSSDVWAVGYDEMGPGTLYHSLIEHWDGRQWSIVKSPNGGQEHRYLMGVTAVSSSDVWAVGHFTVSRSKLGVLVEHWDGTKWSIIPAAGGNQSYLNATVALNSQYVWAVGNSGKGRSMTERWNGQHWQRVPSADPGAGGYAASVSVQSKKDAWLVGNYLNLGNDLFSTMTEHWDGSSWQYVVSPNVPSVDNYLYGVAVPSAQEAWAVGYAIPQNGYTSTTLIEHYC